MIVISLDSVTKEVLLCVRTYILLPDEVLTSAAQIGFADAHISSTLELGSLHYLSDADALPEACEKITKDLAASFNKR